MTIYAIAQGRVTNQEDFNKYLALSGATLEAYQVDLVALDESPVVIEGDIDYARTVILKFADQAHFYRWYESPEYQAARKHRLGASLGRFILVNGF
jgi:uncharacterized protein (DUF1330 family)